MLSNEIVRNGCYIDFEGFAGHKNRRLRPPILLGIYNRDGNQHFRQVVFNKDFRWAAEAPGDEQSIDFCNDRDAFLKHLMKKSIRKKKPLFAFTEHELKVINKHLQQNIVRRFRNVRSITQRWFNSRGDGSITPPSWDLAEAAKTTGITLSSKLAIGGVTSRFREVREYSCSKRKWATAPRAIRKKWREILKHNKSDVMSIYEMMMVMRGLDES
jgi:hypothetical protein